MAAPPAQGGNQPADKPAPTLKRFLYFSVSERQEESGGHPVKVFTVKTAAMVGPDLASAEPKATKLDIDIDNHHDAAMRSRTVDTATRSNHRWKEEIVVPEGKTYKYTVNWPGTAPKEHVMKGPEPKPHVHHPKWWQNLLAGSPKGGAKGHH